MIMEPVLDPEDPRYPVTKPMKAERDFFQRFRLTDFDVEMQVGVEARNGDLILRVWSTHGCGYGEEFECSLAAVVREEIELGYAPVSLRDGLVRIAAETLGGKAKERTDARH